MMLYYYMAGKDEVMPKNSRHVYAGIIVNMISAIVIGMAISEFSNLLEKISSKDM